MHICADLSHLLLVCAASLHNEHFAFFFSLLINTCTGCRERTAFMKSLVEAELGFVQIAAF